MNEANEELLRPEEIVRRENKVVSFLRNLLILVLLIVGTGLTIGSYQVEKKWEENTYDREFESIATQVTNGFLNTMNLVIWSGSGFGAAISTSSDLTKTSPNITVPNFSQLVSGAVLATPALAVYLIPLVNDAEQRKEWEAYAREEIELGITIGTTTPCPACGNSNLTVGLPDKAVTTHIGTFACSDLDLAGSAGVLPNDYCSILQSDTIANCACRPRTPSEMQNATSPEPRLNRIYQTKDHVLEDDIVMPLEGPGPYSPIWQTYPASYFPAYGMYDMLSDKYCRGALKAMMHTGAAVMSEIDSIQSLLFSPIVDQQSNASNSVIGSVAIHFSWDTFLQETVPLGSNGLQIVLENSCGQKRTFDSIGNNVVLLGQGDLHDPNFSSKVKQTSFNQFFTTQALISPFQNGKESPLNCGYRISVYSSEAFRSNYISKKPVIYATAVGLIFVFTGVIFLIHDCYVARRQRKVMIAVLQRDEIVSSLFPAAVRERMFRAQHNDRTSNMVQLLRWLRKPRTPLPPILNSENRSILKAIKPGPIADFFPNVSVVFVDISGFTAWSSEREPSQVFQLLETVYQAFDKIAQKHGVFKIETIGDCYVAVTGIPVFQADHAVRVVQFAYECLTHMHELTHELESTLGPGTSSLSIRVGVHSGPLIAGVLRGEKSRFQLFGDTVNTAARMQTTGENNKIQISNVTAGMLEEANMSHWISPRDAPVSVKGKGVIQTYWVDLHIQESEGNTGLSSDGRSSSGEGSRDWGDAKLSNPLLAVSSNDDKIKRLVEWNTDLLWRLLNTMEAGRKVKVRARHERGSPERVALEGKTGTPFEDVTEIIPMLYFSDQAGKHGVHPSSSVLNETVRYQLKDYVATIASMYNDNPFHNFEHASHVALSASKVVMRIIMPDVKHNKRNLENPKGRLAFKKHIHNSTFGISSDVLMQFAVVFSALIHDVDHLGVSNAQLVREGHEQALRYSNKCVAEQNSVVIAWDLLMKPEYGELLRSLCPNEDEKQRFRQLLVNAVLATDIADKELQKKRKNRWDKAFHCGSESSVEVLDIKIDMDRKATIVFEYIIQASDVAHTMQHWKVYTLWNEKLFEERYKAYQCGREEQDPSIGWYKGEIWFFDNYIIPLAKKLETCGVFGVSSDEYLSYALENRHEWELKGEEIVKSMATKFGGVMSMDVISEQGENVVSELGGKDDDFLSKVLGTLRAPQRYARRHSSVS